MTKFYFTTPLYYPNARLHAGHAYTTLVCDAFARYKRLCGYDVAFLTGTDEHGEKLERAALKAGRSPQAFVAEKREQIQQLWKLLDITYTHFIYTDRPDHTISVQRMLLGAKRAGYIYKGQYEGRYCVDDELYISEGSEPANCPVCGRPGELISEQNYFFKLSAFQERLLELYEAQPDFVQPQFRLNEVKSFVKAGLRDISVSRRRIKWGVPWPDDPEQVFYVWYDALTGYLTGIDFAADGDNEEKRKNHQGFWKWWPADFHMVGKDIIRFHAVYWPAFLIAAGLPLPRSIVAHGWLLVSGDKMSKSKGNAVYVEPVLKLFESETKGVVAGSDVLRYYVLRDIPFGHDGSISYEGLIQRYNSDLGNDLGNLASRTLTMVHKYHDGKVPDHCGAAGQLKNMVEKGWSPDPICHEVESYRFSDALAKLWGYIGETNHLLTLNKPWELAKSQRPEDRLNLSATLYYALETLRLSAVLLCPIIPESAELLWRQLGCEEYLGRLKDQRIKDPAEQGGRTRLKWGQLEPGTPVSKPEIIFPRLDKEAALERLLTLEAAEQHAPVSIEERGSKMESGQKPDEAVGVPAQSPADANNSPQQPPAIEKSQEGEHPSQQQAQPQPAPEAGVHEPTHALITIDDFAKVQMCVGEVTSAEPIAGAKKLLKLMVDIGSEVRQVCAGLAEHYRPEQLVGMKVVVVTNLQPRKLRGVESNGMIVAASVGDEGKPVLATFAEDVPKGARLK
jgi:methionyl-tRNA synthetase